MTQNYKILVSWVFQGSWWQCHVKYNICCGSRTSQATDSSTPSHPVLLPLSCNPQYEDTWPPTHRKNPYKIKSLSNTIIITYKKKINLHLILHNLLFFVLPLRTASTLSQNMQNTLPCSYIKILHTLVKKIHKIKSHI